MVYYKENQDSYHLEGETRKFKIGDIVRIISTIAPEEYRGKLAIITDVDANPIRLFPYTLRYLNHSNDHVPTLAAHFSFRELFSVDKSEALAELI